MESEPDKRAGTASKTVGSRKALGSMSSGLRMDISDEKELHYIIDAVMVFMHTIESYDRDDHRLPELQQLLNKLMFTKL